MIKPSKVHLHKQSKILEVGFLEHTYHLSAELLRTHSPSAEVRGHGEGQAVLVVGKIDVGISSLRVVGHYGLQIVFDDGHDSGIFSWAYLQDLGEHHIGYWQAYVDKLQQQQQSREPNTSVVQLIS